MDNTNPMAPLPQIDDAGPIALLLPSDDADQLGKGHKLQIEKRTPGERRAFFFAFVWFFFGLWDAILTRDRPGNFVLVSG